jgi:hypothetical protein
MVNCKVFKPVQKSDLPSGTKIIDSVWAMKKKVMALYVVE